MPMTWALAGRIGWGILAIFGAWMLLCLLAEVIADMLGLNHSLNALEHERELRDVHRRPNGIRIENATRKDIETLDADDARFAAAMKGKP